MDENAVAVHPGAPVAAAVEKISDPEPPVEVLKGRSMRIL
jgi:hypothetical protein